MSRLDEIKARTEAATPGPWEWREGEPTSLVHVTDPRMHPWNILKAPDWGPTLADAEFIAAAREDVPWLVSEVARLTAERDALAAQVAEGLHLTDVWASDLATDAMVHVMDGVALEAINEQLKRLLELRAALAGSDADTSDTQSTDQEDQS